MMKDIVLVQDIDSFLENVICMYCPNRVKTDRNDPFPVCNICMEYLRKDLEYWERT